MIFNILSYFFSIFANSAYFYNIISFIWVVVLINCITFSFSGLLITIVLFLFLLNYILGFFFKKTISKKKIKVKNA